jgi:hypothetical protein
MIIIKENKEIEEESQKQKGVEENRRVKGTQTNVENRQPKKRDGRRLRKRSRK